MMAGPSNDKCSSSVVCSEDPPPLSITLKKTRDLPRRMTDWSIDHLPVDILLLTVEDCGFLACYYYLRNPFKSYERSIGFVYFGKMGEDEDEDEGGSVKVAIVRCPKESLDPGGSQTATKNAVTLLKPKATFLVGFCYSLNPNKAQLGDVVISSKLITDFHKTPVSRDVGNLVRSAADGWEAPLENPEAREVKVHSDGEIFSCSYLIDTEQLQSHPGAIAVDMEGKDGELKIKVDVDHLKPEEQNRQTGMLATESDRYQEVQQPRVSATSAASGDVSCPKTEDLHAIKEEFFLSIVRKYFNATELQSIEEFEKFLVYATLMRFAIIGVSRGSLVITVKCESLMDLEKLWADYLSGHLGEMVQNCFVTEQILKELNLAELRLKTTMDIEEYNACKMFFEKNAVREFHPTGSTSEGLQKKEQLGKCKQKTKIMETAKSEDTTPHTVVPTTGYGRELEQSRGRTDTVPLLVSPTSDPEGELELKELRMELPRMKDISAEEESCKSDDPSENKRRRLAGGSPKHLRPPKVKRCDEESSPSDALTPKKRKTRLPVKQGVPSDEDLQWLSQKLEKWKIVGRRLEIDESSLTAFDVENRGCFEKIYKMLLHWKEKDGSTATYTILHDALCHPLVKRTDLAEQLITGGSTKHLGQLKVRRRDEESSPSDFTPEKRKTCLADISTEEESCKSDDPSENKPRRLAEPLNVEKCQEKLKSYYDTFSKVKIVPWDESSSIEINEIYTPLTWVRDHRKPSGVTQEKLEGYTDMFKGKHTRMLVYGRPGIGKSTFCKKAAYDWSKTLKEILKNFSILLLIKLRDVCDVRNIRDVLRASKLLASDGPISVDSLYDYIINNQDEVLLILDGYDEYSFAEEHSPILAIWKGEQLRDCHVIVTTRQLACDKLRGPSHVQLEIQGFKSLERIKTFARKFLADEQDPNEFMHYLIEKDLFDMAEIPLLLLMLCILWKEKHHVGLPKSRADIFTQFIQTMLDHKDGSHQPMPFQKVTSTEAKEDFSNLGKAALEALLQDRLYVRCSELPGNISRSFQKLSEVGLFQVVNLTSLNPEKGAYFIHKSVQEFLAAWHIKEEVLSIKGESTPSLSKVESFEKIVEMNEVLKFACELSTKAACAVFHHVGSVGRKESLSKHDFIHLLQETVPPVLSENQKFYLGLISHSYFCCSAEKRRDLCSVFSSYTGGVLSLDSNQLNITANEHLLKSGMIPNAIFFPFYEYSEKSYRDLITVAEETDAVFLSCSGEKKAADLLKKFPRRPLKEFFLKRERKIIVYVYEIQNVHGTLPTEMLRELISPTTESTQVKRVGDPLNEHDSGTASYLTKNTNSITGPTPHSLSCLSCISIMGIEREEMKMVTDCSPLFTALRHISIYGKPFEIIDAQLTETLVSRIIFTDRLDTLALSNINLTAKPTAAIARSLHQAPSLRFLDLSENPLGEGVSVLTQHLSRVPHLEMLTLLNVKMTRQQVNDLSAAVRQSNISWLNANYHDDKGNVKPEEEWPTDEYWRKHLSKLEEESNPWSVTDSGDEEEPGSVTTSGDEEDPGSVTDSSDKEDPGLVTDSGDKEEPGSCLET